MRRGGRDSVADYRAHARFRLGQGTLLECVKRLGAARGATKAAPDMVTLGDDLPPWKREAAITELDTAMEIRLNHPTRGTKPPAWFGCSTWTGLLLATGRLRA